MAQARLTRALRARTALVSLTLGVLLALGGCASNGTGTDIPLAVDAGNTPATIVSSPIPTAAEAPPATAASSTDTSPGADTDQPAANVNVNEDAAPTAEAAIPGVDPEPTPTAVTPGPTAAATAAPTATATPTAAPVDEVSTPTPPPTSAPVPTPTATTPPPPVQTETERSASPDGDSEQSPIRNSLTQELTFTGEISKGEDNADYYEFTLDGPEQIERIEFEAQCNDTELLGDEFMSVTPAVGWGLDSGGFLCAQPGDGTTAEILDFDPDSPLRVLVSFDSAAHGQSLGSEFGDAYGNYTFTVRPIFKAFVYEPAPLDGDSSSDPRTIEEYSWDYRGGMVSAPQGDGEDWFVVTPNTKGHPDDFDGGGELDVGLYCERRMFADAETRVTATLFYEDGTVISQAVCTANQQRDFDLVKIAVGETYYVQVQINGTGSTFWNWGRRESF